MVKPKGRNLTLEQFIEEQSRKTDPFDYESAKTCFADFYDEKTHTRYSRAWEIPYHLAPEYRVKACELGLLREAK